MKDRKNVVPISYERKLCKDCIYNESADDKEYSTKLICGKHSKVVVFVMKRVSILKVIERK